MAAYGNWGNFPEMDYQAIDDAVEIWGTPRSRWRTSGVLGRGAWRRSNGGERFTATESPTPNAFNDPDSAITVIDELDGGKLAGAQPFATERNAT